MNQKPNPFFDLWKRVPVKSVIALAVNFILFLGVFLVAWDNGIELIISGIYALITLAAAIYYITYNRGVIGKLPTDDVLPVGWDKATREAFLADLRARRQKSKWVMTVLIPMILVFAYKMLDIAVFSKLPTLF